eukprot:6196998-Pleurochrysis_carterae.AAC.3
MPVYIFHRVHVCMLQRWIEPHFDTSAWEFFDLSCKSRDDTEDKVLYDAVAAGARIGAIFKGMRAPRMPPPCASKP